MKKIVFLALHLGYGGVERAVINQANILCERYDVVIISAYKLYDEPPFEIDSRIKVVYLLSEVPNRSAFSEALEKKSPGGIIREGLRAARTLHRRKSRMAKAVRSLECDCVISTRILYNRLLCDNRPRGAVIIAQEHCWHNDNEKYIKKLTRSVRDFDYFMPVSKTLTDFYAGRLEKASVKCVYIPHNIDFWSDSVSPLTGKRFVSVGRLSPEKGCLELVCAFAKIAERVPDATLDIIGDGSERAALEEKIKALSLENAVVLHGYQKREYVIKTLLACDVYLMASYEESFGLVLIEAQACGLASIAYDSAAGAREIITDGADGYLIAGRDEDAFAECAAGLICDRERLCEMGKRARQSAEKYTKERAAEKWFEFYGKALRQ